MIESYSNLFSSKFAKWCVFVKQVDSAAARKATISLMVYSSATGRVVCRTMKPFTREAYNLQWSVNTDEGGASFSKRLHYRGR